MQKLNIKYNSEDWRGAVLSNLATTPFSVAGFDFLSVESAIQGIKFHSKNERESVFRMTGMDALKAGRPITNSISERVESFVYWEGQEFPYNSMDHRLLLAMFIGEKVRQNPNVQEALLATDGTFIYHDVGEENPNTSLPEKFYIQILLAQRSLLARLRNIS
ncbi:hypothetical protein H6785_03640 [Candidatus Nomurabacteria bacterium]|nr:hypothetical protein [Candidatus Nomurabacteria bacterium]